VPDFTGAVWRKSSRSVTQEGECVEVTSTDQHVGVRDSKNPAAGHLAIRSRAWQTFITGLKQGQFDS